MIGKWSSLDRAVLDDEFSDEVICRAEYLNLRTTWDRRLAPMWKIHDPGPAAY